MEIEIVGLTQPNFDIASDKSIKDKFDLFSGKMAGICYMKDDWDSLVSEDEEKSLKRANMTKNNGHHSVFDHNYINLIIKDIPKAFAMVLNNEKMYNTSEKSARYTKMQLSSNEQVLFDKWLFKFKQLIAKRYQQTNPKYFTDLKIEKLAQENARYLISVFTPTTMAYSTTYRQLNYLYMFIKQEINKENQNDFYKKLIPTMQEFCQQLKSLNLIDEKFTNDNKSRKLSLYNDYIPEDYFGDVYSINYKSSFAYLAQAQRHRTLDYTMNIPSKLDFYIPPILKEEIDLVKEWLMDCQSVALNLPQGRLISINESGSLDNFLLKLKERKCACAQLEIDKQSDNLLRKYLWVLQQKNHPKAIELEQYTKGSRCTFPNYKCASPCGFKQGVNSTRNI